MQNALLDRPVTTRRPILRLDHASRRHCYGSRVTAKDNRKNRLVSQEDRDAEAARAHGSLSCSEAHSKANPIDANTPYQGNH